MLIAENGVDVFVKGLDVDINGGSLMCGLLQVRKNDGC